MKPSTSSLCGLVIFLTCPFHLENDRSATSSRAAPPYAEASTGRQEAGRPLPTFFDRFTLIDIDTLFYIDNRGITRLLVDVNGHAFKLVVDPMELHQSANAFLIPEFGEITINIAALIRPGDGNYMEVTSRGPMGSDADLIIGDLLLPGQEVAYSLDGIQPWPERFTLFQNYPNPFSHSTSITFSIPEHRTNGLHVTLAIYDPAGRRVQVLVDDRRYPGTFTVEWDGLEALGHPAAGGVYLCRLQAGEYRQTRQLVLVR